MNTVTPGDRLTRITDAINRGEMVEATEHCRVGTDMSLSDAITLVLELSGEFRETTTATHSVL